METRKTTAGAPIARTPATKRVAGPTKPPLQTGGLGSDQLVLSHQARKPQQTVQARRPPVAPPAPPPVPVAESLPMAVEKALKGEPVKTPGEKTLTLQPTPLENGLTSYQVSLEGRTTTIVAATPQDLAVGIEYFQQVPELLKPSLVALRLDEMAKGTFKVQLKSLEGKDEELTVNRKSSDKGINSYTISAREGTLELDTPKDDDLIKGLSQAMFVYVQVPEPHRHYLKTMHIDQGGAPTDEAFAKQYNMPDFTSAATAGNGGINFWHGTRYIHPDYFHHEFGHVIGQHYSKDGATFYPVDWEDAIAKDGKDVTEYGKTNANEDFAESWWIYVTLKQGRTIESKPITLDEFKAQYPNRVPILEAIYTNERKPLN